MKSKTKLIISLICLGINFTLLMITLFYFNLSSIFNGNGYHVNNNPIFIDGNGPNNWNWASSQPWCTGSGTLDDPYIIKNLNLTDQVFDNCIEIRDSTVIFIIESCFLSNANDAGIYMTNVANGMLFNNIMINNYFGIHLEYSNNNLIMGNNITGISPGNSRYGIHLESSNTNNISGNVVGLNHFGISVHNSNDNYITRNILNDNDYYGITLSLSDQTQVLKNTISSEDGYGIKLFNCIQTTFKENQMNNCGIGIQGTIEELSSHDLNPTNRVNNNPIYYYTNKVGLNSNNFTDPGQIILVNCRSSVLSNLNLLDGTEGISLYYCESNIITENNITSNNFLGIFLSFSHNNNISRNTVTYNERGILIEDSNNNTINENIVKYNSARAIVLSVSSNNTVSRNLAIFNDGGISLSSASSNNLVSENNASRNKAEGILIVHSNSNNIVGNIVNENSREGLYLSSSDDCNVTNNIVLYNNDGGIELWWCDYNTISDNNATGNFLSGISIHGRRNTVFNNILINNSGYGIELSDGDWNKIFTNSLSGNLIANAIDEYGSNNQWDDGSYGNYWSDYSGVDANDDGIGDTPYIISGSTGSQDNYPIWDDGPN